MWPKKKGCRIHCWGCYIVIELYWLKSPPLMFQCIHIIFQIHTEIWGGDSLTLGKSPRKYVWHGLRVIFIQVHDRLEIWGRLHSVGISYSMHVPLPTPLSVVSHDIGRAWYYDLYMSLWCELKKKSCRIALSGMIYCFWIRLVEAPPHAFFSGFTLYSKFTLRYRVEILLHWANQPGSVFGMVCEDIKHASTDLRFRVDFWSQTQQSSVWGFFYEIWYSRSWRRWFSIWSVFLDLFGTDQIKILDEILSLRVVTCKMQFIYRRYCIHSIAENLKQSESSIGLKTNWNETWNQHQWWWYQEIIMKWLKKSHKFCGLRFQIENKK